MVVPGFGDSNGGELYGYATDAVHHAWARFSTPSSAVCWSTCRGANGSSPKVLPPPVRMYGTLGLTLAAVISSLPP
jgi:hypothetical protein